MLAYIAYMEGKITTTRPASPGMTAVAVATGSVTAARWSGPSGGADRGVSSNVAALKITYEQNMNIGTGKNILGKKSL